MDANPLMEARAGFSASSNRSRNTPAGNSTEQTDDTILDAANNVTISHNGNDTNSDSADDNASPPPDISDDDEGINFNDSIDSDCTDTQPQTDVDPTPTPVLLRKMSHVPNEHLPDEVAHAVSRRMIRSATSNKGSTGRVGKA